MKMLSTECIGWEIVKIPRVLFFQEGPGVRKWQFTNSGIKLLNGGNINDNQVDLSTTDKYISEEEAYGKYAHFLADAGDLVIACSGIVVEKFSKKIAFLGPEHIPICMNTSTMRFRPKKEGKITLEYFKYFLQTRLFTNQLQKLITGSAQLNFGPSHIKKIQLPLPPLPVQRRIAAALDLADRQRQLLRAEIAAYGELGESLFLEMFGDELRGGSDNWKVYSMKAVATSRLGKMLDKRRQHGNRQRMYLRNANVQWFKFDLDSIYTMDIEEDEEEKYGLQRGDILVCEGGEIGRAAIWKGEIENCYYQKALHRLRVNNMLVNSEYLVNWFYYQSKNNGFGDYSSSVTIAHLTGAKLKTMKVKVPPLHLQSKFAKLLSQKEILKDKAETALAEADDLFQALLQRAFRGELFGAEVPSVEV